MPSVIRHADLVAELRTVRERGLLRLRHSPLPALAAAAGAGDEELTPSAITALLERVVGGMADGTLATACAYTFGVVAGTRDWPAQSRRRRAAEVYAVSPERFRKHHEHLIVEYVAEEILRLHDRPAAEEGLPVGARRRLTLGHGRCLTLCRMPVQALRDVDILVSSENVYLEMSKIFKSSLSAGLRAAAARRNEAGELVDDVLQRELRDWLRAHAREGLAVAPGTVVATSSGELAWTGIRRIYHAATAIPRTHTNDYDVDPTGTLRAVRNAFRLAGQERETFTPPLRSICFPLFGAGRGGLDPATSFAYLWAGLEAELPGPWEVHLLTRSAASSAAVLRALTELGARPAAS
ncbi:hypothetical protein [Nonomuraea typhae]|uniref:hypothetical protein n=1 Tax=Nonomuraea typhae TaxID=2603600 RepID=UPI0012F7CE90|nr:hypothetical protein [Nonomuraea typhae]